MRKTAISRPRSRLVTSLPIPTGIRDSGQAGRLAQSRRQMAVVRMRARQPNFLRATGAKARGGSLSCRSQQLSGKSIAVMLIDASFNAIRARLRTIGLNLLTTFCEGLVRQYRPEAHYVRGPGSEFRRQPGNIFEGQAVPNCEAQSSLLLVRLNCL